MVDMADHSLEPALAAMPGLARDPSEPGPLPPELLDRLPIVPAPERGEPARATRAARTFRLSEASAKPPLVKRSSLAGDAWEIEDDIAEWGLAGREVIEAPTGIFNRVDSDDPGVVEGFIPPSMAISTQPPIAFSGDQRRMTRGADGRRYVLDEHTYIYGDDDRKSIRPAFYPWFCVCRLVKWTRVADDAPWDWQGEASGFLAGKNVCVTASHVFPKGRFAGWKIDVIPGSYHGTSVLGAGIHTNVHSTLRTSPFGPGSDRASVWDRCQFGCLRRARVAGHGRMGPRQLGLNPAPDRAVFPLEMQGRRRGPDLDQSANA
jgi:hypothetical protein